MRTLLTFSLQRWGFGLESIYRRSLSIFDRGSVQPVLGFDPPLKTSDRIWCSDLGTDAIALSTLRHESQKDFGILKRSYLRSGCRVPITRETKTHLSCLVNSNPSNRGSELWEELRATWPKGHKLKTVHLNPFHQKRILVLVPAAFIYRRRQGINPSFSTVFTVAIFNTWSDIVPIHTPICS